MRLHGKGPSIATSGRPLRVATALAVTVAALALCAGPASADRTFATKVGPFNSASSVSFDSNGDVWFSDAGQSNNPPGQEGIYKYNAYPSQTLLAAPNTYGPWGYASLQLQLSVDQETHQVFVSMGNGRTIDIFDENGKFIEEWNGINGSFNFNGIHVAVDNSNRPSRGRVYLSLTSPEDGIEVLDAERRPVDLPASAGYIKDNKITGTPSGNFGQVQQISVDAEGNLYVTDAANHVVDKFDSSGTYEREYPALGAEGGNPGAGGAGIDPTNGNIVITGNSGTAYEYDSSGNLLDTLNVAGNEGTPAVNPAGYLYLPDREQFRVDVFSPNVVVPAITYKPVAAPTTTSGTMVATVDPNGGGNVTGCHFDYGTSESYGSTAPCSPDPASSPPGSNFSAPTDVSAPLSGLTLGTPYHYRAVAENAKGVKYGADETYTPQAAPGLRTDQATGISEEGATLNGSLVGDGSATHYYFEWGQTAAYGHTSAAPPGDSAGSPAGPGYSPLTYALNGLSPYTTYHYRVVTVSGGGTSHGDDEMFTTSPGVPSGQGAAVTAVHADRVVFHGQINPNGASTLASFEYVDDATYQQSEWQEAQRTPDVKAGMSKHFQEVTTLVDGLEAGTLYHYRVTGTNSAGSGYDANVFRTFAFIPSFKDPCPNSHVRQQTGAALLLDCRSYELVSAGNTGGYDVESDLVPGQTPFGGYPDAENPSQVLYGVHNGGIPGTGEPTNHGVDPYVATRGPEGWTTKYVGIPASNPNASEPFASTVAAADASLGTFAFGGANLCSPCFSDGSTGIPVHMPDGSLVQGMVGSVDPGGPPVQAGLVVKPLSADGSHLIFGSDQQFEAGGNPNNGNVTIYDRNLTAGTTQVVSTNSAGTAIADGSKVAELDVSSDGSRIVIGDLIHTDSEGNRYYHLYMHVAGESHSVDLTPGTTSGALYGGMTADGSKVFLTTVDKLTGDDSDGSADLYEVDLGNPQVPQLRRVSTGTGGTGNTDSCEPAANTIHSRWNNVSGTANCDVVGVGGGGGVGPNDGTVYFLSPERLDGASNGVLGAPNLYVARPGQAPQFIRTLESSANAPLPPPIHPLQHSFGGGVFTNPSGVAIDPVDGGVYVYDIGVAAGTGYVYKYDSAGHAVTSFGSNGKLTVSGVYGLYSVPDTIAVDTDPSSPNYRSLYIPDTIDGIVKRFDPSGNHLSDISTGKSATGVAVDPANGNVYVTEGFQNYSSVDVYDATGKHLTGFPSLFAPTGIAVDAAGNAYVVNGGGYYNGEGSVEKYDATGKDLGQFAPGPAFAVAIDPADGHIYVDEGNQVVEREPSGKQIGNPIGAGLLGGSIGVSADSGRVAVSNHAGSNASTYGPAVIAPDANTDSPLVVDSVSNAGARNTADFQVSVIGEDAVFTSTLPLTGYDNAAHREVFRYNAPSATVDCVSCNPTGEQATGDSTLATNGLSVDQVGRVFFNSTEGLVDRDLNGRKDAYEWEKGAGEPEGTIQLISTGTNPLDSSLLGVSTDGTDAYFYTRDTLVDSDANGDRVKIYDARAEGGFEQAPPPHPCQASDECHGPSSQAPPPPDIKTVAGTPVGNAGQHKKKKRHRRHHKRAHHKRGGAK